jgi:hypothetical protein
MQERKVSTFDLVDVDFSREEQDLNFLRAKGNFR